MHKIGGDANRFNAWLIRRKARTRRLNDADRRAGLEGCGGSSLLDGKILAKIRLGAVPEKKRPRQVVVIAIKPAVIP
jgi:hypothetical protein